MRRLTHTTLTAMAAVLALSGTAVAQDLRSPDARDSARVVSGQTTILNGRNLVSPDATDAARNPVRTYGTQPPSSPGGLDLQSPDARDVARHAVSTYSPGHTTIASSPAQPAPAAGFDWSDAGIGAAGMLTLLVLIAAALIIVSHRRRDRRLPFATS